MSFHLNDLPPLPTAPPDPIARGAKAGRQNYNRAVGFKLFHQSHFPFGKYQGQIMQRVCPSYLLWVLEQPWSTSPKWQWVRDYVETNRHEIQERAESERPTPGPVPRQEFTHVFGLPHIRRFNGTNKLACQCGATCTIDITNEWKAWLTEHSDHAPHRPMQS